MRDDTLWQTVLGEIELSVSRGSYITWFKNTRVLRKTSSALVVGVPNIFAKQQLELKYKPMVLELLKKNGVSDLDVEFKIHSGTVAPKKIQDNTETIILSQPLEQKVKPHYGGNGAPNVTHSYRQGLNKKYTFESFIVGSSNELAYAACQAIVHNPGLKYNPLFVYGGVGLGKTHLIQAVGNEILAKKERTKVVYITSEQFVQEFLDAIRYKKITDFAGHYRGADVLIIDDMQFIAGKEKTQEEFFHTFNALHQANKQIIISSDKPPKSIPTLEERLRSRFEWGMIVDIGSPDFETRCAILQNKASQHDITLDQQVVEFLANQVQSNIRELEGVLNQLLAFCEMRGLTPDISIAVGLFGTQRSRPKHVSARQIIEKTAKHFQIELEEILSAKRDKDIVVPRQVAMYLLRSELHLSFPKIARELGRKDHTTAIHSVDKIEKEMNFDPNLKEHIKEIKERLNV
ncbi:chromosomal replication initiator protein DnaA [Candidatus Saccharibacteria bacterium]|jgi:chromosomal replication initiator protein|nr:chromosomal replication initiator protein DnaA [Candidatus Saccharibacteria bacterium]HOR23063.1 chromosomal replication initiator protein DnaA [Candidatus Saccharibacteria bacterium]